MRKTAGIQRWGTNRTVLYTVGGCKGQRLNATVGRNARGQGQQTFQDFFEEPSHGFDVAQEMAVPAYTYKNRTLVPLAKKRDAQPP